jgi:hypothetical protein
VRPAQSIQDDNPSRTIVNERKALMDESEDLLAKDKSNYRKNAIALSLLGIIGFIIWYMLASTKLANDEWCGTCCCCLLGFFGIAYFTESVTELDYLSGSLFFNERTKVNKRVREIEIERQEYEKQLEDEKK